MLTSADATTPFVSVTGVSKAWGLRARRWLANRSLAAWYDAKIQTLNAFPWSRGPAWSEQTLRDALAATKQ